MHPEGKRIFEEFSNSITKRRAIERELEIIGEATNNLLKFNADIKLTEARKIISLCNRVIHAYGDVDETIILARGKLVNYCALSLFSHEGTKPSCLRAFVSSSFLSLAHYIWKVIVKNIPVLSEEIEKLLFTD